MACVKKRRGKWVVDWRDTKGRRHWETMADKEAAQLRLAKILSAKKVDQERRTFREYGDSWLEDVRGTIKESSYQEYEAVLRNHVYPTLGDRPFIKVKRTEMRELIQAKKKENCAQSTIKNIIAPVRCM